MKAILALLKEKGYAKTKRFPLRRYPLSISLVLNELGVMGRFLSGRNNVFSVSLAPSLYSKLGGDADINFLRDIFFLNKGIKVDLWESFFTRENICLWKEKGLLSEAGNNLRRFNYRVVPYERFLLLTSRFDRADTDFTFLSYDSLYFASFLQKRLSSLSFFAENGIDLCCGVGVQAISISRFCKYILGTDINKKSIELARLNASLNDIQNCNFAEGSLFGKTEESFDLIVSNPPFMYFKEQNDRPIDSDGGEPFGLGATLKIISSLPRYLSNSGRAFIITRSPMIKKEDYLFNNLSKILPAGFGCLYHYVSDAINGLSSDEAGLGFTGFRQVIMEISKDTDNRMIRYPFFHRKTPVF